MHPAVARVLLTAIATGFAGVLAERVSDLDEGQDAVGEAVQPLVVKASNRTTKNHSKPFNWSTPRRKHGKSEHPYPWTDHQHLEPECRKVKLLSQRDVEAFPKLGCEEVYFLSLKGTNVTDLRPLSMLRNVSGTMEIYRTGLVAMNGLENAIEIHGLFIIQNEYLESLRGLGRFVTKSIVIDTNPRLTSLDGFNLTDVHGPFRIATNHGLRTFRGLESLRKIFGRFTIWHNGYLESFHGLENLLEVWGNIDVLENGALATFQGFNSLKLCGTIVLQGNGLFRDTHRPENLGGLFSNYRSDAVVNNIKVTESWPRCVTPQESSFLSHGISFREPYQVRLPKGTWTEWLQNDCGPGPLLCWTGMPCMANLTAVTYIGHITFSNTTCGLCDKDKRRVFLGPNSTAMDLTDLLRGELPGNYSLCRCEDGPFGFGPVAQVSLAGLAPAQNFTCVRGADCKLHVLAEGVSSNDSVVVKKNCHKPGPDIIAYRDDSSIYAFSDNKRLAGLAPKTYSVCWWPPCTIENEQCGPTEIGKLTILGPEVQIMEEIATINGSMSVNNDGSGVDDTDRMMILEECGKGTVGVQMSSVRSFDNKFRISLDDSNVRVGKFRKCWCKVTDKVDCTVPEHFLVDVGGVHIVCPRHFESPDGNVCQRCKLGRVKMDPDKEACQLEPGYLVVAVVYSFSLFVVFYLILSNVSQPLRIEDISTVGGKTFIKTVGNHMVHMYCRKSFSIKLLGTVHRDLDNPKEPFRACKRDKDTLELLTNTGGPIEWRLDSSRGCVALSRLDELWHRGWPVPMVLSLLLFTALGFGICFVKAHPWEMEFIGLAIALPVAYGTYKLNANHKPSSLEEHIESFREVLLKSNPDPKPCEKGPSRAIQILQLFDLIESFHSFVRDRNAYYMDGNIFGPLTAPLQLSYAELVGPRDVEWFVSHYWGHTFIHFFESLRKHAEFVKGPTGWHQVSYWICFCSNNQYQIKHELGSSWEESSFFLALHSGLCTGVCMVLDDLAVPLTRSWCIFELLQTLKLERSGTDFMGLMLCTTGGVLNSGQGSVEVAMNLARKVSTLDLEHASASCEEDKDMINRQVVKELGSFHAMNSFVREKMLDILMQAQGKTTDIFTNLFELMHASIGPKSVGNVDDTDSDAGTPAS